MQKPPVDHVDTHDLNLIGIRTSVIVNEMKAHAYQEAFGGTDELPSAVESLYTSGMYAWIV